MVAINARIRSAKAHRACLLAALFAMVALTGLAPSGPAQAQSVGLSKTLCTSLPAPGSAAACTATTAPAFVPVYYKIVVNNSAGGAGTVALNESYPSNFQFVGVTCTATNGASVGSSTGPGGTPVSVSMAAGQTAVCVVQGYFTQAGSASNMVSSGSATATRNTTVPSPSSLPTDLSIVKTASVTQVDISGAPATVVYTVTITNNGANAVYLGQLLTIRDSLSLYSNGVPLSVTYVAGSTSCSSGSGADCVSATPTLTGSPPLSGNFTPFLEWKFPTSGAGSNGFVPVGGTITLTYEVAISRNPLVDCIRQPGADGLRNRAELILDPPGPISSLVDTNTTNNVSMAPGVSAITGITAVDPQCAAWGDSGPPMRITKVQTVANPSGGWAWGSSVAYSITIENLTNQVLPGVQIKDFVMAIPGSPTFTAQQVGAPTVGNCQLAVTSNFTGSGAQTVSAYYTPGQVGVATVTLQPHQICTFTGYNIRYQAPGCDAFTNANNPIRNSARAVWTGTWTNPPNGGLPVSGTFVATDSNDVNGTLVDTLMAAGPACDLRVTKFPAAGTLGNIQFGVWNGYKVSFRNNNAFPVSVGTLYDAIRLVQPNYAASLGVDYQYNCTPVPGIANAPTSGSGTTNVVYTQHPHQGARIINGGATSGPVVFGALKTLNCDVKIRVSAPPPGAAYCLSAVQPELENTALMMSPAGYSANGPWPPTGTYDATFPYPSWQPYPIPAPWGTVVKPLPKCFSLQVNKDATPTVTWTTSSTPETYTITVQNLGDGFTATGTVVGNWQGPVLRDTFTTGTPSPPTFVSLTPSNCCVWLTAPPSPTTGTPLAPAFMLGIKSLAALGQPGDSLTLTFKINPGPYVQPKIANEAVVFRPNANGTWYSNDPSSCYPAPPAPPYTTLPPTSYIQSVVGSCARVEVPVMGVGKVKIIKVVNNVTGAPTPVTFAMTLTCTFNGTSTSWPLSVPPGTTGVTQNNIPQTSTCLVTEPALTSVGPTPNCMVGAAWTQATSAQPVTVQSNATQTITVTNTLTCIPPGPGLTIKKVVIHPTQGNLLMGPAPTFQVNVACTDGYSGSVTLTDGGSQTLYGPSANTSCAITETLPPSPFQGNCPILMNWMAPTLSAASPVTVGSNGTTVTLTNRYQCFTSFGTLIIKKVLVLDGNLNVTTPFQVQVSCAWPGNPPSYFKTVALGASQSMQQTLNQIPLGMACTVVESPPPPLSFWQPPCRWLTTYVGSTTPTVQHQTTVTTTSQTLTILNEQTCNTVNSATEAEFKIYKEVWTNGVTSNTVLSPMSFSVLLTCTGRTPETITINTPALGLAQVSRAIAAGSTCTVYEATQGPPPTAPAGCTWSGVTYRWYDGPLPGVMGSTVTLTQPGRTYGMSVRNNLTCPPQMPPPPGGDGRRSTTITPPPPPPPLPRDDRPPPTVSDGSRPVDGVSVSITRPEGGAMATLRTGGEGDTPGTRLPPGVYRLVLDPVSLMKGLTGMPGVKVSGGRPPISIGVGIGGSTGSSGGGRDGPDRGRGGGGSGAGGGVSIGIPLGGSAPKLAAVPGSALVVTVTVGGQASETRMPCCDKRGLDGAPPIYITVPEGAGPISVRIRYAPPPKKR